MSYPFPLALPLSFARSRESKCCPNSRLDRGVELRGRGRYPLKPRIFASLLETEGYPEHTAARYGYVIKDDLDVTVSKWRLNSQGYVFSPSAYHLVSRGKG